MSLAGMENRLRARRQLHARPARAGARGARLADRHAQGRLARRGRGKLRRSLAEPTTSVRASAHDLAERVIAGTGASGAASR
jgi:hypothetical protein